MTGPLISAHRGGADPDRPPVPAAAALEAAARLGCDFVELDVRRSRDGVPVVRHEETVPAGGRLVAVGSLTAAELERADGELLRLADALRVLDGRAGVHLDLKSIGPAPDVVAVVDSVVREVGAERVLVTGLDDGTAGAVRAWSRARHPALRVALALGRDLRGLPPVALVRTGLAELFPAGRLRRSDANLVVCQRGLARARIAGWARRRGLPLLVWTVNEPGELRRWLRDPRTWAIVTDRPALALRLRRETAGA